MAAIVNYYPPILNPGEPFTYLPPDIAYQLHIRQYVGAATTSVSAWELFFDLPNIYQLFIGSRPTIPGVVYVISRVATLLCNALWTQFSIVGGDCASLTTAIQILWVLASAFTTLLFFFRVRALYRDNRVVVGSFGALWLCTVGGAVCLPIAIGGQDGVHILPDQTFCIEVGTNTSPPYTGLSILMPAIYDTFVFCAISYRLFPEYELYLGMTWMRRAGLFFTGQGLPRFSKALLQGGQQYYLVSVAVNIFALTFYYSAAAPVPYHIMVALILITVMNSMACKVYRDIKFGRIPGMSLPSINIRPTGNPTSFRAARRNRGDTTIDMSLSVICDEDNQTRPESTKAGTLQRSLKLEADVDAMSAPPRVHLVHDGL
ncbi:hypothetical protein PENSPDRAFT_747525 [Peniophora sp. CONT]|nr:hypothetical protein PENSPDRAFT_747525 [Peniophora sp. CONT]